MTQARAPKPTSEEIVMRTRYEGALPFPAYLETVVKNKELWTGVWERARVPGTVLARARSHRGPWHLLALSEDWCGDAANILPVVARLSEAVEHIGFRVLSRDENSDLMDRHLTNGTSRSIPVVILLDADFRERGWWGPRPSALQRWVMEVGIAMDPKSRYAETRRFYARDKGKAILAEIMGLIEEATASTTTTSVTTQ